MNSGLKVLIITAIMLIAVIIVFFWLHNNTPNLEEVDINSDIINITTEAGVTLKAAPQEDYQSKDPLELLAEGVGIYTTSTQQIFVLPEAVTTDEDITNSS